MNLRGPSFRPYSREPLIPTIAIIGAGFSGTLVAINFLELEHARPFRILLVDRNEIGRGIAYASRQYPYLLNIPVGGMSASCTDPMEFLRYLQRDLPLATVHSFVPRETYGEYLRARLARADVSPWVQLVRIRGSATAIERTPFGFHIRVADGHTLSASTIVLALGNPPPARIPAAESVRGSSRYVEDPWAEAPDFSPGETILIAGTGLTMADIALAGNQSAGGKALIHAISPHGLISAPQVNFREPDDEDGSVLPFARTPLSARGLFRLTRALCEEAALCSKDWRWAISRLCAIAPTLWHDLPECERRRFLRHARSYWEVHRHRLPLRAWNAIKELRERGTLHVHAGRLVVMQIAGKQIRVRWRPRGARSEQILVVDRLVNCTGPDYDLRSTRNPLWHSLFTRGMAAPDPLGLGILTNEFGALLGASGRPVPELYYIGPMLRAGHWEATAVQELRGHAERLARHLAARSTEPEALCRETVAPLQEERT
jgi:uncharacterized NAD(P)/FAD-binding protein YdhS